MTLLMGELLMVFALAIFATASQCHRCGFVMWYFLITTDDIPLGTFQTLQRLQQLH